ncbi:hypothetical protein BSU04_40625 [Caballeronia sordidicola]|uniref:Uncharacterized protein n=1 Tax=Caballeronia sordidicola TaxID=196367 RepID=A0A226WNF9_CABSO|nr:hypothetical protein BSU04_40625 [Caballeronia sordidicola]
MTGVCPLSAEARTRWSFAETGLVDENVKRPCLWAFLSAGHVLRFQSPKAFSSRSTARFSGFCGLKPNSPSRLRAIVYSMRGGGKF